MHHTQRQSRLQIAAAGERINQAILTPVRSGSLAKQLLRCCLAFLDRLVGFVVGPGPIAPAVEVLWTPFGLRRRGGNDAAQQ